MRKLVVVYLILAAALGTGALQDPVGTKCPSLGIYPITTCLVTPFPPTSGQPVSVSVTGTFTTDTYISQIRYSLQGQQNWNYQYTTFNLSYPSGLQQSFAYFLQIPQYHDSWLVQITVIGSDLVSVLGCWEFAFRD